jgi:hypothetical protein
MRGRRPLTVTIVALIFIAVGIASLAFQVHAFRIYSFHLEDIWITLVHLLAIVAGAFMLRGDDWARWLAVAWIAFHVGISFFNAWRGVVVHAIIAAGIIWLLFQAEARAWFRGKQPASEA